ncbi:MAG: flagellar biosynthetic protein FliR [Gemmobacter sp.]|jgi:flagellar biosynthetic protein FliR|nr:flagellar biosynthetic protein FliR [Gemmobacter sp.]
MSLFALLTQLSGLATPLLAGGMLILLRVGAAVALLPGFGETALPPRVKLAAALAFTCIVMPAVLPEGIASERLEMRYFLTEPVIGLLLGLGLRFFIFALQTAGMIIAQSSSLAQIFGGMGEGQPAMGNTLTLAGIALFMAMNLHLRAAELLIGSYEVFPPGHILPSADLADWGLAQVVRGFGLAMAFAAPFVIGGLIYNVALGVVNKAMPQLMVAFVGAPALTLGGLILFALVAPLLLGLWLNAVGAFLDAPFGGRS